LKENAPETGLEPVCGFEFFNTKRPHDLNPDRLTVSQFASCALPIAPILIA